MNEQPTVAGVEIRRVWRDTGQHTTIRLELAADGYDRVVRVHRSMNPTLFDFIVDHATMCTPFRQTQSPATPI